MQSENLSHQVLIAPSILSADFLRLGQEIKEVEAAGADWIHVDVMDGHFVPNLTIGPMVVQALRKATHLPLDCHLMVSDPQAWITPFADAGVDYITVHAEATSHLDRVLNQIRDAGCKVGVSLNPASPLSLIQEVLPLVDLVLVMSVNPGFGGQKFIEYTQAKVVGLSQLRDDMGLKNPFLIEVDGGVYSGNIGNLRKSGADVFVAGSAVFGEKDRKAAIHKLRQTCSF